MQLKTGGFVAVFAALWLWFGLGVWTSGFLTFVVYTVTGGWRFLKAIVVTLPRDVSALLFVLHAKKKMKEYQESGQTIISLFHRNVQKHPNKLAFILVDGKEWTFQDIDDYSNSVANYLYDAGYRKGDVIAMFMESRPEYVCFWLGMAKIGVIPALINFNLRMDALAHCIKISEAKGIILGAEYAEAMKEIRSLLTGDAKLYITGNYQSDVLPAVHIDPLVHNSSSMKPPKDHTTKFNETLFYVYTSGTTGLPKAAIVIHSRYYYMAYSVHYFFKMNKDDIIYDTLPLYHTAGGILGTGQALINGCTVVIRKKFSASRFWDDCVKYNATVAQYIGEICRYLLAQPSKVGDRQHRVRVAFGNGLRPQIWVQFMQRFGIERIGEFYGATEGNANIINSWNKVGAIGFTSVIAPNFYPVNLIRVDEATGKPLRDRNGICIMCKPGEPGEMVGKIVKGDPLREFDGYVNKDATSKKIAHDVFHKGDTAFLTGDVLEMDEYGYMYFKDRTGDTFRWKGENVSTSEVEATISNIVKLNDAVVYGVEIPNVEGRAGMAAIVDERRDLDLGQFYQDLKKSLPPYAHPVFLRILDTADTTGTFKLKKTDYKKDFYNPSLVSAKDHLYYLDGRSREYRPIDHEVYQLIATGKIRF